MKYKTNKIVAIIVLSGLISLAGCSGTGTSGTVAKKAPETTSPASTSAGSASTVVKEIYDDAFKGNCSAIPSKLTEEFRKAVGSSNDELEALCDTFTDSKKIASADVKGEEISGDTGKVKVALIHRDGKTEEKDERVKKEQGKWVMDS